MTRKDYQHLEEYLYSKVEDGFINFIQVKEILYKCRVDLLNPEVSDAVLDKMSREYHPTIDDDNTAAWLEGYKQGFRDAESYADGEK